MQRLAIERTGGFRCSLTKCLRSELGSFDHFHGREEGLSRRWIVSLPELASFAPSCRLPPAVSAAILADGFVLSVSMCQILDPGLLVVGITTSHSQTWATRNADRDPRWTRMHFGATSSTLIMIVCVHRRLRTSILAWKLAGQTEDIRCRSRGNDPWFDSRVIPACTSWQPSWSDGNRFPYLQDVPDLQLRKRTLRESARKNEISPLRYRS